MGLREFGVSSPPGHPRDVYVFFDNVDFVMFDVEELVPLLGEDGMVETEAQDDESRVALQINIFPLVYGNTRKLPRWGHPDVLPSHDLNQLKADRFGLSKKQNRTAERSPRRSIAGAGLHGTFRRLVLAEYPTFENVIDVMASLAYKLRPNDDDFV